MKPSGGYERISWGVDNFLGAGAIVSTVDDLLRWLAHMDRPSVGSQDTWRLIKTSYVLNNGHATGYGFGLFLDSYLGIPTIHHAGGAYGGNAQLLKAPSIGLDIVVVVNRQDANSVDLTNRILAACLPELPSPPNTDLRSHYTGVFLSEATGRVIHLFQRNGDQIASISGSDLRTYPESDGSLVVPYIWSGTPHRIVFQLSDRRTPKITYHAFGNRDELVSIPEYAGDPPAAGIAGRYVCISYDAIHGTVDTTSSNPKFATSGQFGSATYSLKPIGVGVWRVVPTRESAVGGATLTFARDFSGFWFSTMRTYSLPFRRIE